MMEKGRREKEIVIDSSMTFEEAMEGVSPDCPREIFEKQRLMNVSYLGYDGKPHIGQIVMDERHEEDLQRVFELSKEVGFPIFSAIPISKFNWDDDTSLLANNTAGFNYREMVGGSGKISNHALGWAIDFNPVQNPYIKGEVVLPPEGTYNPEVAGTFTENHPLVLRFKELGWTWGGEWSSLKDYQHFEKKHE